MARGMLSPHRVDGGLGLVSPGGTGCPRVSNRTHRGRVTMTSDLSLCRLSLSVAGTGSCAYCLSLLSLFLWATLPVLHGGTAVRELDCILRPCIGILRIGGFGITCVSYFAIAILFVRSGAAASSLGLATTCFGLPFAGFRIHRMDGTGSVSYPLVRLAPGPSRWATGRPLPS